jgi:hypothetical protein
MNKEYLAWLLVGFLLATVVPAGAQQQGRVARMREKAKKI